MVGWQDSSQTTHDDPLILALQTWNSLRAVDYLVELPGVDPARIGVTGASGGGTQSLYLSLIDERVTASAPVVIVYPWAAPEGCRCEGGLPVMQEAGTNAIELAAAMAPRAQLLISAGDDPTKDFPTAGFPFVRHIYALCGHPERVENVHLTAEGHDFGPSKRAAVYNFFARHLGLRRLPEDREAIVIEAPEQMAVFDAEHPLPPGAVRGPEGVAASFRALARPKAAGE
jgi:hypothetical protein